MTENMKNNNNINNNINNINDHNNNDNHKLQPLQDKTKNFHLGHSNLANKSVFFCRYIDISCSP